MPTVFCCCCILLSVVARIKTVARKHYIISAARVSGRGGGGGGRLAAPRLVRLTRGSGWGLVLSVIWPFILMFSVKILMFYVLKKLTVKC